MDRRGRERNGKVGEGKEKEDTGGDIQIGPNLPMLGVGLVAALRYLLQVWEKVFLLFSRRKGISVPSISCGA